MNEEQKGQIILYQAEDGTTRIEVRLENENLWLTQAQLVELYQSSKSNISAHIKHIFEEGELSEEVVVRKFRTTTIHGAIEGKTQENWTNFYNLDMIISLGYRIKSRIATRFRIWATAQLKEFIIKGFAIDDERLKQAGVGGYWKELLDRVRDIRSSEKVFYRQVLDIYATSTDYEPNSEAAISFFKKVQNKIHYAVHGQTAAEVIFDRVDAEKEFMGLTTYSGNRPHLANAVIAKNYLNEKELRALNQIVSGYLDFAERQAERQITMTMMDWSKHLDGILTATGEQLLQNAGNISHEQAVDKAKGEYKKFQAKNLSAAEKDYLNTIKNLQKKVENKG